MRLQYQNIARLPAIMLAIAAILNSNPASADSGSGHLMHTDRPDGHAPIGVMAEHIHREGETMFSYRFMHMAMDGNRNGSTRITDANVLTEFMITPTQMDMQMHMLGAMHSVNDRLTLMGMVPVVQIDMDHVTRAGGSFTTRASGVGDVQLSGLFKLFERPGHQVHSGFGVSVPTGSIDKRDDTPAGPDQKLPYPMQLGSGTYDVLPTLTYNGQTMHWSWGAQASAVLRVGHNDENYTLGDVGNFTFWGARRIGERVSASLRVGAKSWGNIDGADPELPAPTAMIVPTADPNRRGGDRIDLAAGINVLGTHGKTAGHRLAIEVGLPVYQHLDGPQLETDWTVSFGWQFTPETR